MSTRSFLVGSLIAGLLCYSAPADAGTSETTTPYVTEVTNPCTGELVTVTGKLHVVTVVNDNKFFEITTNWPETFGLSNTGARYQVNDTSHSYAVSAPKDSITIAFHEDLEVVSLDSGPNWLVHMTLGFRFDPTTMTFTEIDKGSAECSGQAEPVV